MGTDLIGSLLQYGAVGVLAALALTGVVVLWRREVAGADRERELNAQLRQEIKELNGVLQNYLLTMPRASAGIEQATTTLRTLR